MSRKLINFTSFPKQIKGYPSLFIYDELHNSHTLTATNILEDISGRFIDANKTTKKCTGVNVRKLSLSQSLKPFSKMLELLIIVEAI